MASRARPVPPSRPLQPLALSLGITAALLALMASSRAQAQQWTGAVSGDVTDSQNWNPSPSGSQFGDAVINGGTNPAEWIIGGVPVDTSIWYSTAYWTVNTLSVGSGGSGQLDIDVIAGNTERDVRLQAQGGSALTVGTQGGNGVVDINLRNGTTPGINLFIESSNTSTIPGFVVGSGSGSQGTVNVLGSGKRVQSQASPSGSGNQFSAGKAGSTSMGNVVGVDGGTGTVSVQDSALVFNSFSSEPLPVFSVGNGTGSNGRVNVLGGGKLAVTPSYGNSERPQDFVIGLDGGTGTVEVSGANDGDYSSKLSAGNGIDIGRGAGSTGTLNVLAGGKAANYQLSYAGDDRPLATARVGVDGGSGNVLVSGAGSVWYVGSVAVYDYFDGDQTVVGEVLPYNIGALHVGAGGQGALTIADGGVVSIGALHVENMYQEDPDTGEYVNWHEMSGFDAGLGPLYLAEDAAGSGRLDIGGAAGQAAVAPGTLQAAQILMGPGAATVAFNHTASDYVFSVPLVGTGTLASYAGTTYLQPAAAPPDGAAVDNSGFAGTTEIHGGALGLRYNAALGSSNVSVLDAGGGLVYGAGTQITNPIDIAAGAVLTASNEGGGQATQSGLVSGAGELHRAGPGTLSLTAANTYTGQTVIEAGTLALVGAGSLEQSGRVVADGSFDISATDSGAAIRSLAGSGTVNLADRPLSLTQAGDTFAGVFIGSGALSLQAGNEVLTGASTGFTGSTTLNGGALWVNGTLGAAGAGPVTVSSGARLGGDGSLGGSVSLADGAFLTPGAGTAQPGTLNIGGNLSLSAGSVLEYDFGEAGVAGGGLNDLVNIGGDLVLAGTLDIATTAGGSFEPGIYRVMNYAGALTDNGLVLGSVPVGGLQVQTAIAQEVNLVYTPPGTTLAFWDGDAGPKNNGRIDGGNGSWQASAGNDNWTNLDGNPNAPFSDGAFAVFAGRPGTVTIDNSLGAVTALGLQFAGSGYVLQGDPLTLAGDRAYVRVGEGLSRRLRRSLIDATINAPILGAAELVKDDVGTLVLGGDNQYSGGTRIQGGIIEVSRDANLGAAAGALTLAGGVLENTASFTSARQVVVEGEGGLVNDAGTTLTLGGALDGSGTLSKDGAGTLAYTGSGGFAGQALINAGSFAVDGQLAGAAVVLASGTSLTGNGLVGALDARAGATVAPGHSIGTLGVAGNYQQAAGAVYAVELDPASTASDRLLVTGTATLAPGAALLVSRASNAPYVLGNRYTVLQASGGLSGSFVLGGETAVSPFAVLQDSYDANNAYLQVTQTRSLTDLACARNAAAAAGGLQSAPAGNAALNAIVLDSRSDAQACQSLDQLSGEAYASLRGVFLEDSRFLREAVGYRLRGEQPGAAANGQAAGLWGHVFGSWARHDARDSARFDRDIGGAFFGGDGELGDWTLGGVGGYSRTSVDMDSLHASARSNDYYLGLYAGNQSGALRFHGGASYAWHDATMRRRPAFDGYQASLSSDFDASTAQAWAELAYEIEGPRARLQPFVNAAYVRLRSDGFDERGDAASALSGRREADDNTFATLGARLIAPLGDPSRPGLELRASAGWRHAFGSVRPSATLGFEGGAPFTVISTGFDRDALALDLGIGGQLAPDVEAGISYSGLLGGRSEDHGAKAYLQWKF